MRRLACLVLIAFAGACDPPAAEKPDPAAEIPDPDANAFRAEGDPEKGYAGEWAASTDSCRNQREIWTIEDNRMGMKRQRFCVFERVFSSSSDTGEGWSASARCLAGGKQSHDFVFFRLTPNRLQMRVTINDSEPVDLVRCPMRT